MQDKQIDLPITIKLDLQISQKQDWGFSNNQTN
jgi:hypothetical protein